MSDDETQRDGWFVRAAGAVGDLGNPFYREERQRDVWNEASAVGFQLMLVLGMAAAAAMIWIGGAPARPYVLVMVGVIGVSSLVTITYAQRLGVRPEASAHVVRWRMLPYVLLVGVVVAGLAVHGGSEGFEASSVWGAITGAGLALVLMAWAAYRARRRESAAEVAGE